MISRTDQAGTLRSDTVAGNGSAKQRLGEKRDRRHANLLHDDRERQLSDDNENDHFETRRKIGGARKEKGGKQTYAARVLGDLKLVKENRDLRGVKSEVSDGMRKRLGSRVKQDNNSEDEEKNVKMKRKIRSDSPVKQKIRKVEQIKSKSSKKSTKRSVEVDSDGSYDEDEFKNLKITKAANTSSDFDKSFDKSEPSALHSSKDYAPIKNRKIKLKKKKGKLITYSFKVILK